MARKKKRTALFRFVHIDIAIVKLFERQLATSKVDFTSDELLALFVEPDHHSMLKQAYTVANPNGYQHELYYSASVPAHVDEHMPPMTIKFSWSEIVGGFFVPKRLGIPSAGNYIRPYAPADLREKFTNAFNTLADLSYRFGAAKWVFNELDNLYFTAQQIRYVWPCIVPLLRMQGQHNLAAELLEANARAGEKMQPLPPKVIELLNETNKTIAKASLIEGGDMPRPTITYNIHGAANFRRGLFLGMK